MGKYYVVWKGRKAGVYDNWESCLEQVHKFSGAKYKSFATKEEAYAAYNNPGGQPKPMSIIIEMEIILERIKDKLRNR